jgi:uncharacterized OB-fold protein
VSAFGFVEHVCSPMSPGTRVNLAERGAALSTSTSRATRRRAAEDQPVVAAVADIQKANRVLRGRVR